MKAAGEDKHHGESLLLSDAFLDFVETMLSAVT